MTFTDFIGPVAIILLAVFSFRPIVHNFKVVWSDPRNPRSTPLVRKFLLLWMGLAIIATFVLGGIAASSLYLRIMKAL